MKKHISKIMIVLAILFFIVSFITILPLASGGSVDDTLKLAIYFSLAGLFLGLYRIIDLLEKK